MNKILTVALREYLETVKTRAFFFGVILMPVLIVGIMVASVKFMEAAAQEAQPPRPITIIDRHGAVYPLLEKSFAEYNAANPQKQLILSLEPAQDPARFDALLPQVRSGDVSAMIDISPEAVTADGSVRVAQRGAQIDLSRQLSGMVHDAIVRARFAAADPPVDRDRVLFLERPSKIEDVDVATGVAGSDDRRRLKAMTPFIFVFILYMGTMGVSWGLLTSVIEEKNSRIVEVLLSALSPLQLMAGKIIGMVLVGMTMLLVWGVAGFYGARAGDVQYLIEPRTLALAFIYFIPGFLLMSSMLASVGAACNTLKEAQNMSSPLTLVNIVPIMLSLQISQYPNSVLSIALSYIPPITPFVMILRICGDQDLAWWELVATQALLWAAVLAAIWAASKIFRIGILMYGKPPSLGELARWVRYA